MGFGGTHLFTGGNLSIYTEFKNLWSTSFGANYEGEVSFQHPLTRRALNADTLKY